MHRLVSDLLGLINVKKLLRPFNHVLKSQPRNAESARMGKVVLNLGVTPILGRVFQDFVVWLLSKDAWGSVA